MAWDQSRPGSDPKYATREHKATRAAAIAHLNEVGFVICAHAPLGECQFDDTNLYSDDAGQRAPHLCHDASGENYIGLGHGLCNVREAAVRASEKSRGVVRSLAI